jgi:hypothetical protein
MKTKDPPKRWKSIAVKVSPSVRRLAERLAAHLTLRQDRRWSLTDVVNEGLLLLAEREKVKPE